MRNSKRGFFRVPGSEVRGFRTSRFGSFGVVSGVALSLLASACSSDAPIASQTNEATLSSSADTAALSETGTHQEALQQEVNTLLGAAASLDGAVQISTQKLGDPYGRIQDALGQVALRAEALSTAVAGPNSEQDLQQLSIAAGQLTVQVARLKRVVAGAGLDAQRTAALTRGLETVKLASRSLGVAVAEYQYALTGTPAGLDAELRASVEALNGALHPGSSWYVLSEGHVDAMDVGYEDSALGVVIHDETAMPPVERDPAKTVMVAKSASKLQVPDARFSFLGPVGSDVWILPQGQPEAAAAGILWPGLSTEEVDFGVFVGDEVQLRIRNVVGPNGVSLFESPEDEFAAPLVLADSEDGLPDTITAPVGLHRHMNWAFEAPGVYLIKVQARGRLSAVAGHPWVNSPNVVLKFVVLP